MNCNLEENISSLFFTLNLESGSKNIITYFDSDGNIIPNNDYRLRFIDCNKFTYIECVKSCRDGNIKQDVSPPIANISYVDNYIVDTSEYNVVGNHFIQWNFKLNGEIVYVSAYGLYTDTIINMSKFSSLNISDVKFLINNIDPSLVFNNTVEVEVCIRVKDNCGNISKNLSNIIILTI